MTAKMHAFPTRVAPTMATRAASQNQPGVRGAQRIE
jgi:hypothetical protein